MSATILNCQQLFESVKQKCADRIRANEYKNDDPARYRPRVLILTCTDDDATARYLRNKCRDFQELGIEYIVQKFSNPIRTDLVHDVIEPANRNPYINGIMVQLPFENSDRDKYITAIDPRKDIDGMGIVSAGQLWTDRRPRFHPCTPEGIMMILNYWDIPLVGENVCVINRSNIVGKPLANLLLQKNACVTICHSKMHRERIVKHMKQSSVVISAVGRPNYWKADDIAPGSTLIDVSINLNEDHKLCGDFDKSCAEVAGMMTPVPGGVGLMTRAVLLHNIVSAWEEQNYAARHQFAETGN